MRSFLEIALNFLDNYSESWFKPWKPAGGVARCSTYLFPMRSPGSHPPFRGFPLSAAPPFLPRIVHRQRCIGLSPCTSPFVKPRPIAVLENCVEFYHDLRPHPAWSNHVIARSGTTKQSHYWLMGDCFGLRPRNDNLPNFAPTRTDITFENAYRSQQVFCCCGEK